MSKLLKAYRSAGYVTKEQIILAARARGNAALLDVKRALLEDVRQNSTAMVIVSGDPPGKNVTDMIRRLIVDRTKLIVVAQSSSLGPGDFERLLRASMPDVEKKLRVMDDGNSVADAVSSAERNRHYRPSQALEVFCSKEQADAFTQEIRAGSLKFDPTVIAVNPIEIPTDDVGAITSAINGEDLQAMHRVLDPHIFSNQGSLQIYKNLLKGQKTESLIRESSGLLRVYHGTNRRIDTPQDPVAVKAMMSGMDYGPGMYFTTSPRDAKEYGFNLYQADVDFKNPLVISSEMSPEMDKFRKSFDIGEEEMEFTDEGVWHCIMGFVISLIDAGLTSKKKVIDTIRKLGHDGIIVPAAVVRESKHGSSVTGDYVIVFDPSQITNWGEAVAASMLSRKKESIDEQAAGNQDSFLSRVKLGTINWDFREKTGEEGPVEGGFKAWSKKIKIDPQNKDAPRFVCAVIVSSTVGFSKLTGRGSVNAQGFMVDTEIYQYGDGKRKWFYHNEKRLPTPEAAQSYAERIKSFIDGKTLSELLGTPKSGKISMSKFEQIQRFGALHEFLSDIAPTRELGISKLRSILMDRMGDTFDELEYLGSGRNGSAYRTIEGPVLKITTDREEAKSANTLRGKKCEYIYHVHSVTKVSEGVWLILQEGDLEKLPDEYCEEFDTAVEILETIGAGEALRTGDVDSILEIMIKSEHVDLCDLVTEVMEKFGISGMLDEISKLGLSADFHSGNIKLRNGRPVLIDLGTPGDDHNMDKKVNQTGSRRVIEFTGMQSAGSAGQMRGSNSSAWAGGRMVLSKPEQHVPEDENATERDNALDQDIVGGGLDWGHGRRNHSSF